MSEKHYLAYHTPTRMKYGGSKVNAHFIYTSKGTEAQAAARDGATVWLIGREEGVPGLYWYGWLTAKEWKASHFPGVDFTGELHGDPAASHLRPLDGGERVLLDGKPWLKEAMDVLGNGAFGLQVLQRPPVIAGLEELRRTMPRMVSGPPRARQKKQ